MTPFTCEGRMRLKESHEMWPKASGVTNSVASTSPNRSTTVSHTIELRSQWRAARSGNGDAPTARRVSGAGAVAPTVPVLSGRSRSPVSAMQAAPYDGARRRATEMTELSSAGHRRVTSRCVMVARKGGALRILVLEDEPRIRAFLARGLEAEGFTVVGAQDGQEGLRLTRELRFDLVLLD